MVQGLLPVFGDNAAKSISVDEALTRHGEGWNILAWFRDPRDRMASMMRLFARRYHTPERLAQVIIDGHKDPHWTLQLELLTHNGQFLPTDVYKFDTLKQTWRQELPGKKLGKLHLSGGKKVKWTKLVKSLDPATEAALLAYLQPDIDYYEGLT